MASTRGPLPARVYWIRRGVVLGVAALLVLGLGRLLGGFSDGSDPGGPAAEQVAGSTTSTGSGGSSTPPSTSTPTSTASKQPKKRAKKGPKASPRATAPATPDGPCADDDVRVTPATGKPHAGGPVRIALMLNSIEAEACSFTVSPDTVALKLTNADGGFVWSSQQCPQSMPTRQVVVRRNTPTRVDVVWHGRESNADCALTMPWVLPGAYAATGAAFGGEPTTVDFDLLAVPRVVITKTIAPKPKQSATAER